VLEVSAITIDKRPIEIRIIVVGCLKQDAKDEKGVSLIINMFAE
jgi:hypothetical protein